MASGERPELRKLVSEFSREMREKLLEKEDRGWIGWDNPAMASRLKRRLADHLICAIARDTAQWVDVGNFAAFLWWLEQRGKEQSEEQS